MNCEFVSLSLDELKDRQLVDEKLKDRSGIYVWTLFPNLSNFERIAPFLGSMAHNRVVDGSDRYSDRRVRVTISADTPNTGGGWALDRESIGGKEGRLLLADLGRFVSTPIYIGMSFKNIHDRARKHVRAIDTAFDEDFDLSQFEDDSEATSFAQRIRKSFYDLEMPMPITPNDFGAHFFLVEDGTLNSQNIHAIEIAFIRAMWPVGNHQIR